MFLLAKTLHTLCIVMDENENETFKCVLSSNSMNVIIHFLKKVVDKIPMIAIIHKIINKYLNKKEIIWQEIKPRNFFFSCLVKR